MRPLYKFYIFKSATKYVSKKMAKDIIFREMKVDPEPGQALVLKRTIEGKDIFWLVCQMDGKESICVGCREEMSEFSTHFPFGEKIIQKQDNGLSIVN